MSSPDLTDLLEALEDAVSDGRVQSYRVVGFSGDTARVEFVPVAPVKFISFTHCLEPEHQPTEERV